MRMKEIMRILLCGCLFFTCAEQKSLDKTTVKKEVLRVLEKQVQAWNSFDIEGFMEGYLKSDSLRFASGGRVSYGWQTTLEGYKTRYPDSKAMGKLTFSDLDITVLSSDAAFVFGRFRLEREHDEPTGLFTLLFRKTEEGWRIVHDHTSSAQ